MGGPRRLRYCVNNEWRVEDNEVHAGDELQYGEVMAEAPCCTVEEGRQRRGGGEGGLSGVVFHPDPGSDGCDVPVQGPSGIPYGGVDALRVDGVGEEHLRRARGDVIKSMEVVEMACGAPILMQGMRS